MNRRTFSALMVSTAALGLAGCGSDPRFQRYEGPEVTRIVVQKGQRKMYLMNGPDVLKAYEIDLGFAPDGHKQFEGDGKTPEGSYFINRRNANSAFHLSLGISYPNAQDIAAARAAGKQPGGDIFIHGERRKIDNKGRDWTWGCVSVKNEEIEEIYSMVRDGTQIDLNP